MSYQHHTHDYAYPYTGYNGPLWGLLYNLRSRVADLQRLIDAMFIHMYINDGTRVVGGGSDGEEKNGVKMQGWY